ncbi:MAG: DUF2314 domain-containing protein [Candidatus Cloacimonetes bacterium]|nr:DUF2314 domain-containing protein [Candidatus Cloacimonadota bacterium]
MTLNEFFGKKINTLQKFKLDSELQKAVFKVQSKLTELKRKFEQNSALYLLVEFSTLTSQTNWLWVEVLEWEENSLTALLLDQPTKTFHLRQGSKVKFKKGSIKDYQLYSDNVFISGNLTYQNIEIKEDKVLNILIDRLSH